MFTRLRQWLQKDEADALPEIAMRRGKSMRYMLGHVLLPELLLRHPAIIQSLVADDGLARLHHLRDVYARRWQISDVDECLALRYFLAHDGAVSIVVTMPDPVGVPEPHYVMMYLLPVRRILVLERASVHHLERFRRQGWRIMSSDIPQGVTSDQAAYLCEWTHDGNHFNYGLVELTEASITDRISDVFGVQREWSEVQAQTLSRRLQAVTDVSPVRAEARPLPEEERRSLNALIDTIVREAQNVEVFERGDYALRVIGAIEDVKRRTGNVHTDTTIRLGEAIRLFADAELYDKARDLVTAWIGMAHAMRGSRSPEVRIAYAYEAWIAARERSNWDEHLRDYIAVRLNVRDSIGGVMRTDMPGANDPMITMTIDDMMAQRETW